MAYGIGIMSGTSLDGIDVALIEITGLNETTQYQLLHYDSYPYDEITQVEILKASHINSSNVEDICALNFKLGKLYSEAVQELLMDRNFKPAIDFIALHGQTIHHLPHPNAPLSHSTLQIGDPSQLAYDHKTTVISNFRAMDMIAGGNGAPLVPYTEYLLYRDQYKNRLLQNIGGIGNVTILPKNCHLSEISAFDTGPGNMMINSAMQYLYQKNYDHNGEVARMGRVIPDLLQDLQCNKYFTQSPPKTTGRELFGEDKVHHFCQKYGQHNPADIIRTLTEFTVWSIADSYQKFIFPNYSIDEILMAGGGAYNSFLIERLRQELTNYNIQTLEDIGFNSDAKEAIAFAILGNQTLNHQQGNLPNATGAKHPVVLGSVTFNPWC